MNLRHAFWASALLNLSVLLLTGCGGNSAGTDQASNGGEERLLLLEDSPPSGIVPPKGGISPALIISFKSVDFAEQLAFTHLPTPVANPGPMPGPSPQAAVAGPDFSNGYLRAQFEFLSDKAKECLSLAKHAKENGLQFSIAGVANLATGGPISSEPPSSPSPTLPEPIPSMPVSGEPGSADGSEPGVPPVVEPGNPPKPGMPAPPVIPGPIRSYYFTTIFGCTIE